MQLGKFTYRFWPVSDGLDVESSCWRKYKDELKSNLEIQVFRWKLKSLVNPPRAYQEKWYGQGVWSANYTSPREKTFSHHKHVESSEPALQGRIPLCRYILCTDNVVMSYHTTLLPGYNMGMNFRGRISPAICTPVSKTPRHTCKLWSRIWEFDNTMVKARYVLRFYHMPLFPKLGLFLVCS